MNIKSVRNNNYAFYVQSLCCHYFCDSVWRFRVKANHQLFVWKIFVELLTNTVETLVYWVRKYMLICYLFLVYQSFSSIFSFLFFFVPFIISDIIVYNSLRKGMIRCCKSKKGIQYNGQKKKDKKPNNSRQNNTQVNKDWASRTPLKPLVALSYLGSLQKIMVGTTRSGNCMNCEIHICTPLVEETGEKHGPVASHWKTLSHNAVSSTPHREWDSNSQL